MTRVRAQLSRCAALTLALFVVWIAAPSAGLYYHEHAGGEHGHVHLDDGSGHDHHDHAAVAHHLRHAAGRADAAALEDDDHGGAGHWHSPSPFQRAVAVAATAVIPCAAATALPASPARRAPAAPLPIRGARGPPRPPTLAL